jgi:hypothetical protein
MPIKAKEWGLDNFDYLIVERHNFVSHILISVPSFCKACVTYFKVSYTEKSILEFNQIIASRNHFKKGARVTQIKSKYYFITST